jgi:His-Xaa-Ser system radical SAM maturase HxsC
MILSGKAEYGFRGEPFIAQIVDGNSFPSAPVAHQVWLDSGDARETQNRRAVISFSGDRVGEGEVRLPPEMNYLRGGDIIRLNPANSQVRVLYRQNSRHNVLFFTERCNSRCLMCSQPPRAVQDDYLVDEILQMIPWMAKETPELGITGGEPTLLGPRLIEVIESVKQHLPDTALHMLSNGRLFSYLKYAHQVADVRHPNFMIGIPVYSDTAALHDYVVQAKGAFDQTLLGLLNLGRVGVRIEIRMVIHRETYRRLPEFARFVVRNLPFVDQVVLMGLELMGFARSNLDALWIDPVEYQDELEECISELAAGGLHAGIYNHQLCLLRPSLWSYARKSISDWKNIYTPECEGCAVKNECCGFFASSELRYSPHIKAAPALSTATTP